MGGSTQPMNTAQTYAAGCAGLKRRALVDHEHGSIWLRAVTLPLHCKLGIGIELLQPERLEISSSGNHFSDHCREILTISDVHSAEVITPRSTFQARSPSCEKSTSAPDDVLFGVSKSRYCIGLRFRVCLRGHTFSETRWTCIRKP